MKHLLFISNYIIGISMIASVLVACKMGTEDEDLLSILQQHKWTTKSYDFMEWGKKDSELSFEESSTKVYFLEGGEGISITNRKEVDTYFGESKTKEKNHLHIK